MDDALKMPEGMTLGQCLVMLVVAMVLQLAVMFFEQVLAKVRTGWPSW